MQTGLHWKMLYGVKKILLASPVLHSVYFLLSLFIGVDVVFASHCEKVNWNSSKGVYSLVKSS